MCLGLFVECLAEVLIKGVEKDIFDGQRAEVIAVEFASSLCLSNMRPIVCPVAGAAKTPLFYKGFKKNRLITVTVLPVLRQLYKRYLPGFEMRGYAKLPMVE